MKQLTCEMCGSTDLIKQDGVFVCQTCGCKYSLEEAKKMMVEGVVEVSGMVRVDESAKKQEKISNYLEMAEAAFEGTDIEGVVNYCDKALEIDPENYRAWVMKAKAAGWGSTLKNIKIPQAITAAKRAINLTPDAKKYNAAEEIYWAIKSQVTALLRLAQQMPSTSGCAYIQKIMLQWQASLAEIPCLPPKVIEHEIDDCKTLCRNSAVAIMPNARLVFSAYFAYNNCVSYGEMFSKTLTEKIEQEKARQEKMASEIAEKRDAYWAEHKEEREQLESEQQKLYAEKDLVTQKINDLIAAMDAVPTLLKKREKDQAISDLKTKQAALGVFKAKEKHSLQVQIEMFEEERTGLVSAVIEEQTPISEEIEQCQNRSEEITQRLQEIQAEFDKDR